jgi:predicted enzyme related to lactoylglutathione lyase
VESLEELSKMSATNYTPIQLYYSTTAAAVPVNTNLVSGELAINITDGKLYYKDNGGTVRLLASNATSAPVLSFQTSLSGLTPSTATTGVVTLAGTLGTSSGGTNLTSFTSGGAVYATSTSVLTTGTLPTTAGGTALTSFTSGGVVYASSTSALATGSALTFSGSVLALSASTAALTVKSTGAGANASISIDTSAIDVASLLTLNINGSTTAYIGSGGATYPNLGGNSSLFLWNVANGPVVFATNNTEGMRLTSTGLGIGTSSPSQILDVQSIVTRAKFTSTTGTNVVYGQFVNTGGSVYVGRESSTGATFGAPAYASVLWSEGAYPLVFATNNATKMTLDSAGNLGLGVTPSAWNTGYKAFVAGGTNSNNQVGGIASGSGITIVSTNYYRSATPSDLYAGTGYAMQYKQTSGEHQWLTAASGTAGNVISFTQAMTLDASGRLLIGATSTQGNNSKLQVSGGTEWFGSQGANGPLTTLSFYNTNSSGFQIATMDVITGANFYEGIFRWQTKDAGGTVAERARISSAGGFSVGTTADPGAGAIYATGNITAYYSSDIKFKENVRDIPDALATVNAIGGKLFDWTDEYIESKGGADGYFVQKADFGVVAQDVQKVFPIAVRTREDGSLAVDYEKLGALAFAALVEITKRVEALEAK